LSRLGSLHQSGSPSVSRPPVTANTAAPRNIRTASSAGGSIASRFRFDQGNASLPPSSRTIDFAPSSSNPPRPRPTASVFMGDKLLKALSDGKSIEETKELTGYKSLHQYIKENGDLTPRGQTRFNNLDPISQQKFNNAIAEGKERSSFNPLRTASVFKGDELLKAL